MHVSDNLVDVNVHLVVGLLDNKVVELDELLVVLLLNPDVVANCDQPNQHLLVEEAARTYLELPHLWPSYPASQAVKSDIREHK